MATDKTEFFVQICISHFGTGNQWTSDGKAGPLCALVKITKLGNLNNNSAYSILYLEVRRLDSNQAKKNKNSDNSIEMAELLKSGKVLPGFPHCKHLNLMLVQEPIEIDHWISFFTDKSKHMAFKHSDWLETN